MVCVRCQMVVKSELEKLGLQYSIVELGRAEVTGPIPQEQMDRLKIALKDAGLELLEDSKTILVESIITSVIELYNTTLN